MQVRIHPDIAELIRRNAKAYKRMFKRHKSAACIVNEALRDLFAKQPKDGLRTEVWP